MNEKFPALIPEPRDVSANLEQVIKAVMNQCKVGAPIPESDIAHLRDLVKEYDSLRPWLLADPFREARRLFSEQQGKIASGAKVQDAWNVEEFRQDHMVRFAAVRARMSAITVEIREIAIKINAVLTPLLKRAGDEIEFEERAKHAEYGVDRYLESALVKVLKDSGRRIASLIPSGDAPCSDPRTFVSGISL